MAVTFRRRVRAGARKIQGFRPVSYLLDTNVVSELTKETRAPKVVSWVRENHEDCFLSAVTIGELVKGVELMPEGKKRRRLAKELGFPQQDYRDRIIATA